MSEHTPTPWARYDDGKLAARGWIKSVCKGIPEQMVAQAIGVGAIEEREANAAFIVRAVNSHDDLVKALEAMLEKHGGLEISPAARQARAALAKAVGGANG
jgi:hypothetical protein